MILRQSPVIEKSLRDELLDDVVRSSAKPRIELFPKLTDAVVPSSQLLHRKVEDLSLCSRHFGVVF